MDEFEKQNINGENADGENIGSESIGGEENKNDENANNASTDNGYTFGEGIKEPVFTAQPIEPKPDKYADAFALTSMIVGICSIVLCIGFVPAVVAIVFGALAKNRGSKSPMATAGIATGVVALCLGIAYCITVCGITFSRALL